MSDEAQEAWSPRRQLVAGLVSVGLLVGGFGIWSVTTHITGAVVASGKIEVDRNRQVVQHQDGGTVDEVLVQEGDMVDKGQLLIRLDSTTLRSELAIVESQLFELVARRGRLEAEQDQADEIVFDELIAGTERADIQELMDGQLQLFEARNEAEAQRISTLETRREQIVQQVEGISAQEKALQDQLGFVREELGNQEDLLSRGLAQSAQVLSLRREEANLSGRAGELSASRAEAAERSTEIDLEIQGISITRREEAITQMRDVAYRELELRERRSTLIDQLDRLDIRAPVAGHIYGMQVFGERAVLRPADPVAFIVPQNRPLIIASQVPTIHVDQVHPGQEVLLRFSAFDQRRTPELYGRVTQVSADAFDNEQTGMSFYRAEIVLSEDQLELLPEDMVLVPGMPVEAFMRTTERTPMAYLTKPLADYFAKAFREG